MLRVALGWKRSRNATGKAVGPMARQQLLLDRYRIIEKAGAGGYGTVQHAYDTRLKRDVAIKCIPLSEADVARARLLAMEAKMADALAAVEGDAECDPAREGLAEEGAGVGLSGGAVRVLGVPACPGTLGSDDVPPWEDLPAAVADVGVAWDDAVPGEAPGGSRPEGGGRSWSDAEGEAVAPAARPDDPWCDADDDLLDDEWLDGGELRGAHASRALGFADADRSARPPRRGAHARHAAPLWEVGGFTPEDFDDLDEEDSADDLARHGLGLAGCDDRRLRHDSEAGSNSNSNIGSSLGSSSNSSLGTSSNSSPRSSSNSDFAFGSAPASSDALPAEAPRLRVIGAPAGDEPSATVVPRTLAAPASRAEALAPELAEAAEPEPDLEDDDLFDHIPGLEEARTAAQLSDANIVTVYDCELHDGVAYVIMEYIEGKTLARIMREEGDDITLDIVAAVFASVSHALKAAHGSEVLHLDIKPDNVIVNRQGQVKVTDFGLATLMDASGQGTAGGGTIGYMPLEQMRQKPLDERTDEWALASLAYEMLSGDNPFLAHDLDEAEAAIEDAELVLPSLCWDDLDQEVDDIMFKALDPDPDERYATVEEFADELEPLLGSARRGKDQLADIVCEVRPEEPEESPALRPPAVPLVDRLGPRGGSVVARVLSAGAAALLTALALANVRLGAPDAAFGLATSCAPLFWGLVAGSALVAALRPHLAALASLCLLGASLFLSGAFLLGLAVIGVTVAWWRGVGRAGEPQALSALLQPLAGAVGFGALAPVMAGALLPLGQALLSSLFSVFTALALASLGSCDLMGWNPWVNLRFAGFDPQASLVATLAMPQTWCVAASWVLAAGVYSLLCVRGTRAFDALGSVAAAAVLVAGACMGAGLESGGVSWLPSPTAFTGALLPGCAGIVLALMGVPDRARWAPEEWDAPEDPDEEDDLAEL